MFTELIKIIVRLVNNLSKTPSAQDNLSKLLTALSTYSADTLAKNMHKSNGCWTLVLDAVLGGERSEQL